VSSLRGLNGDSFKDISPERLRDEFVKILNMPNADMAIRMLNEYNLLSIVLPSVTALKELPQSAPHVFDAFEHTLTTLMWVIEAETGSIGLGDKSDKLYEHIDDLLSVGFETNVTNSTVLRLGALLHDVGKAVTQSTELSETGERVYHYLSHDKAGVPIAKQDLVNLKFSGAVIDTVSKIVEGHMRPLHFANSGEASRRSLYRFFRDYGSTGALIAMLAWADGMATYDHSSEPLEKVVQQLVYNYFFVPEQIVAIPSLLNGNDLMRELNMSPGKQVGKLLEAIKEQQVEQKVSTYDEAIAYARDYQRNMG
jgi:putative nucleotidyltransferase with HDIG domain